MKRTYTVTINHAGNVSKMTTTAQTAIEAVKKVMGNAPLSAVKKIHSKPLV